MLILITKEGFMIPNIKSILYPTWLGNEPPFVFRYALSLGHKYDASIHVINSHEPFALSMESMANFCMSQ